MMLVFSIEDRHKRNRDRIHFHEHRQRMMALMMTGATALPLRVAENHQRADREMIHKRFAKLNVSTLADDALLGGHTA